MRIRAAVLHEQGLPRPYRDSRPFEVTEVELDPPGPGEVLVRIAAAGLCHSDLSAVAGARARILPAVGGHEGAGEVLEVGPGVDNVSPGDHVVLVFVAACGRCRDCVGGRPNLCPSSWASRAAGTLVTGARRLHRPAGAGPGPGALHHWSGISCFADHAVVAAGSVVRIPRDVPLLDAASFGCAVITGVGAVVNTAAVGVGASVAIVGLGGVGLSALLGAVLSGANPIIAIDLQPAKLALARSLGATHALPGDAADLTEQVHDLTGGGVDHAFDMAGGPATAELAYGLLRRGGALVVAALADPSVRLSIPIAAAVSEEKRILGSYMGSANPVRDIGRFVALYRAGRLPVDRLRSATIDLAAINEGFDRLADGLAVREVVAFGP
ncbi:MAG: zinc-binding dehydrogenase [Acidimicrobiia bacterium]